MNIPVRGTLNGHECKDSRPISTQKNPFSKTDVKQKRSSSVSFTMFVYRLHALMCLMIVITILMQEMEYVRSEVFQQKQKRQTVSEVRQYCGRSLSNTLEMICDSVYNSRFKKSNQEMEMNDYAFNYDAHPYKSIENARKMLRFRRNSRGIYEECCVKSCSTEELRSYCGAR